MNAAKKELLFKTTLTEGRCTVVQAKTHREARALAKKYFGLRILPAGAVMKKYL